MRERCLTEEELQGCDSQDPSPDRAAHLARCPGCSERLAAARADASLFAELRGVAQRPWTTPSVPGYKIESELSRGGQGVIYRAVQDATQRVVALKILAPAASGSARERRRFEREVELGSRLSHPGIVTVFDSGVTDGAPWYAMELVAGETLDAHVARTQPALDEKLRLFLALCAAVAHAHRAGILHRDLKPANVLVDATGRVRVLDFGTAIDARRAAQRRVTAPGEFLGTLAYAAPEQVTLDAQPDTRSDVYSLGVMLYELVTGRLPYDVQGSLSAVVENIARAAPAPPALPRRDRDLAALLATALEKDRERRYPSVEALARDLEHFLARQPLEARRHELFHVTRKALARHRRAVLVTALLLLLGGGLIGAALRERWRAERARENAALVSAVMQDLLGAAAPQRMGADAPLRDVLALAAREIGTTLEGAPDAQAAVQLTLGDTYRRLLMHTEAETHLRAALERFRAVDGADQLEVARCLDLLGLVLTHENHPEAVLAHEEALALRRAALDPGDPRIAESERGLAVALAAQFREPDLERARALLASALERLLAAWGEDHLEVAETQVALARLESWSDSPTVEGLLARALATFDRHAQQGERGDPRSIACLTEYAAFLQSRGRLDEAEALLERAARLTEELYGGELAAEMLRRFARLRMARGDALGAEELLRRALARELAAWGERRPEEAQEIGALTTALEGAGAEPPYAAAFARLRRYRGDGAFEVAQWMNTIAVALAAQGRAAASEPVLREALNIRCRAWGSDCPVRQRSLLLLAGVLRDADRKSEAVPFVQESLRIAEHHGDEGPAREARALLASCCASSAEAP